MKTVEELVALWQIGVDAVRGDAAVARVLAQGHITKPDRIVAVGKAAAAMAAPAATAWPDVPCLIITKYGHAAHAPAHAEVIEAAHPVPDAASLAAGQALQVAIRACPARSEVLMLVSGGASSLVEVPTDAQNLETLMASTQDLLASGAQIGQMNAHRTAQSQIKGGKLLAGFQGARVTTLALSDVEGDALMTIGSGIGAAPPNPAFAFHSEVIASNAIARSAIAAASPLPVQNNSEALYDDVVALAPRLAATLTSGPAGLHIYGGEPVVQLPAAPGTGGRNMALALGLAREIAGRDDIRILVAGTDGTDGPTDAAGACVDGTTWDDSGADALARADAYPWLEARDALVKTGPTGTNVMDLLIAHKDAAR
ncbi:DUF4147 domain-containing protein [uncultured Tateyamaria sp.]|uniref:DUF4147 domain-containing protein n=1 Tax=uncultured Tateyamaria sp. TaxID=455651 RepID=UPI00261951BA|nr:DUF4147 domain-containing protein [uncultured Tateyamaria sp.]